MCTGVYQPDKGTIAIQARVQLLALGVGFQRLMTGRENVFVSGSRLAFAIATAIRPDILILDEGWPRVTMHSRKKPWPG